MKNKEKYAKEIVDLVISNKIVAIDKKTLKPAYCEDIKCRNCLLLQNDKCIRATLKEWAEEEYKEPLLDDIEKEYILNIIKPFKNQVEYISVDSCFENNEKEYLTIDFKDDDGVLEFPSFEKGKMYKGLERVRAYTLEELGLED